VPDTAKIEPFGRGRYGKATVCVNEKDREGFVHGIGVDDGQPDGMLVGELHVDAETDSEMGITTVILRVPTDEIARAVADKRSKPKSARATIADVTYEMEIISDYWQASTDPKQRSQSKTVDALLARQAGAQVYERTLTNQGLRLAVKALADPQAIGGPYAQEDTTVKLRGGGHPYTNITPYTRGSSAAFNPSSKQKEALRHDRDESAGDVWSAENLL